METIQRLLYTQPGSSPRFRSLSLHLQGYYSAAAARPGACCCCRCKPLDSCQNSAGTFVPSPGTCSRPRIFPCSPAVIGANFAGMSCETQLQDTDAQGRVLVIFRTVPSPMLTSPAVQGKHVLYLRWKRFDHCIRLRACEHTEGEFPVRGNVVILHTVNCRGPTVIRPTRQ